jgi:hypothetical protein
MVQSQLDLSWMARAISDIVFLRSALSNLALFGVESPHTLTHSKIRDSVHATRQFHEAERQKLHCVDVNLGGIKSPQNVLVG